MNPTGSNNFRDEDWAPPVNPKGQNSAIPSGDYVGKRMEKFKTKLDAFIDELKEQNLSEYITDTNSINQTEQLRGDKITLQRIIKMKDFVIQNLEQEFDRKVTQVTDMGLVIMDLQSEVLDLRRQESEFLKKISQLQDQMFSIVEEKNNISQTIQNVAVLEHQVETPPQRVIENVPQKGLENVGNLTLEEILAETELGVDLIRILNEKKEIKLIILAMMLRTSQDMCLEIINQLAGINYLSIIYASDNDHNPLVKLTNGV